MLIFYERRNVNKIWKFIIGQKNCIDSKNELIIFVKRQNLTNTFNPFLLIILRTPLQKRFKILSCYCLSNNSVIYIKVLEFMSVNFSIYELCAHNIDAILEILTTTCSCVFNEHKIFNRLVSHATSV